MEEDEHNKIYNNSKLYGVAQFITGNSWHYTNTKVGEEISAKLLCMNIIEMVWGNNSY